MVGRNSGRVEPISVVVTVTGITTRIKHRLRH